MDQYRIRTGKSTLVEGLIALTALIGFFSLVWLGAIQTIQDVLFFACMLGVIVLFYFLLMLARAIFLFMAGGDSFWWQEYESEWRKMQRHHEKKAK